MTDVAIRRPLQHPPPDDDDPVLASKFVVPEPPRFMVSRPRLLRQLSPGDSERVTVVTGPAGGGKTQLVASWVLGTCKADHVVWITMEDEDNTSRMFWTYVVEGLRRAGLALSSLATPVPATSVDRSFLVRLAAGLADVPGSVVLVLDGVSALSDPQWATDLDFVARHAGPGLRLVLVGRWDPPLPMHRYRLDGTLTEVRSADLAFSREEAAELLDMHGINLSPPALGSLMEHTEGWAAGLRLFALALRGRNDADLVVDRITGEEATIAEYFTVEVLRTLPAEVRGFLLDTSILDTFTPDLAQALTGHVDAAQILAELERENAFVRPTGERSLAYRYHRLFAELLRARLAGADPDRIPRLHRRAAQWFAEHGQVVDAVTHAVRAGDWGTAAATIVADLSIGTLLIEGRTGRLGVLLRGMPDDLDHPEAAIVTAALAVADGNPDLCVAHLSRAEKIIAGDATAPTDAMTLARVLVEVRLAEACQDPARVMRATSMAEALLATVPADRLGRHPDLHVLVLAAKGMAKSWIGDVDAGTAALTEAAMSAGSGCETVKIACLQHLALIRAYEGHLREAERLAHQALELADRCGLAPDRRPVGAAVTLAWVAVERYDIEAAAHHFRVADPRNGGPAGGPAAVAYALAKSRRLQSRGELRGAMHALRDPELTNGPPPPVWLAEETALTRARLLIMMGIPDEGLAIVRGLPDPGHPGAAVVRAAAMLARGEPEQAALAVGPVTEATGVRTPVAVDAWLVLATVAVQTGDPGQARTALRRALQLAAPESHRRSVYQVWAQLRRGLRDDHELAEQYRALAGGTAAATPARARPAPADPNQLVIVEPLSKREMEVLGGMAAMLPTEEIAASMYVSVNTVKTHVRSILRKLCASRRNEAVRRARAIGLI
ncbi:LuxR C-terminal-related transcriptional regulator [Virgisporangium aurantiacum]|uniref:Transcriptional regulator n=1 Tax=Virgisporangium aurantiacum TaxID=175570 RepID=A0A8J4DZ57_9ACTN|nr:LuxR C-terminal-related transcriptional regulator [Virgisporangium aurantiacum]GIJ55614.1 transcriptional regulator [Virgisporangium aurantiacum]